MKGVVLVRFFHEPGTRNFRLFFLAEAARQCYTQEA